ncbi:MAG TPA: FtsX-like permease family protein [Haliangiales bacterium]|nr:FtsX-like permease family protein [Haliangiales bacterium]
MVGVVADVHNYGLDSPPTLELYVPHAENAGGTMTLAIRGDAAVPGLAAAVRAEVGTVDPELAVDRVAMLGDVVAATLTGRRLTMDLLAAFAAVVLVLATLGVYGVLAYGVAQRGREIAIRLALGAGRRGVLALVLGEGMTLVGAGIALGFAGALVAAHAMRGLTYGVSTFDPLALSVACGVLGAAGLVACWLPARRACRIDPVVALRHE